MSKNNISTKVLPGFMELLPGEQAVFDGIKETIEETYRSFGFLPIDTPAIERAEVLLAKAGGETEKQIYRFSKGENDLALRFDLTVPLARYVSEHVNDLNFPFRRYHVAKVYRGERPQKGRFREFYQCDIDVIGKGTLDLAYDAELMAVIYQVFSALKLPEFRIRVNNRKVLSGFLSAIGAKENSDEIMRVIDKMEKVPQQETRDSLSGLGLDKNNIKRLEDFFAASGEPDGALAKLESLKIIEPEFSQGLSELREVISLARAFGLPEKAMAIDLAVARGLDYYTGTVYETILVDYPQIGSICSGGRYDNLAGTYGQEALPGVGISIGLTRLFDQLRNLKLLATGVPSRILVIPFDQACVSAAVGVAGKLRETGLAVETYLENTKFKNKLSYANRAGIRYVVLVGEDEIKSGAWTLKDMESGQQESLDTEALINRLKR